MQLFGITLRKPTFGELTATAVMAAGLWIAGVGIARASGLPLERADAGALLVVIAWGCVAARIGLAMDAGRRHAVANLVVGAGLLGVYQAAALAFGG